MGESCADWPWVTGVTAAIPCLVVPEGLRRMYVHIFVWGILNRFAEGGVLLACMRRMTWAVLLLESSKVEKAADDGSRGCWLSWYLDGMMGRLWRQIE